MQALDQAEPNFNDADYQLAAYAAALKVLTRYSTLDGRNVQDEVFSRREKGRKSDFEGVIERALGIACDVLIPRGLDAVWRDLALTERYYLRALDIESRGERRNGMYEELARGFGVTDQTPPEERQSEWARTQTATGLGKGHLAPVGGQFADVSFGPRKGKSMSGTHPFAVSPLRHLLYALRETSTGEGNPEAGRQYLRFFRPGLLDAQRAICVSAGMVLLWSVTLPEWTIGELIDSESARILAGRLRNDHA